MKHEIDSVIKHNEFLAEHTIKNNTRWLFARHKHGNNMNTGNSKRSEPQKFILSLLKRLDLA